FFFSSRRRHTRFSRDWSSDVCSSDLRDGKLIALIGETRRFPVDIEEVPLQVRQAFIAIEDARFYDHPGVDWRGIIRAVWLLATKIGRASCREGVEESDGAVELKGADG